MTLLAAAGALLSFRGRPALTQRRGGGWLVVKRGAEGVAVLAPDGRTIMVPAQTVEVRDTTGAGDSFNAGLVYVLSRRAAWPGALAFATRVAAAVVSRPSDDRHPSLADLR